MSYFNDNNLSHFLTLLTLDGVELCVINGDLHIDKLDMIKQDERQEVRQRIMQSAEELKLHAIRLEQERQDDPKLLNIGRPIVIFYANLLCHGVTLKVNDGQLRIGGHGRKNLSPVYRDEIVKRAEHLIELLSPTVPAPLQPYFGRLITVKEVVEVIAIAEGLKVGIRQIPVNGGWLCLMSDYFVPAKPRIKSKEGK